MQVQEIMTPDPACCTPDTPLQEVARMMIDCDCGAIPVVDSLGSKRLVGMITDRDITCRAVAEGRNPLQLRAADCMTRDVVTVRPDSDLAVLEKVMQERQIRRVPVVDSAGCVCGIVAQADVARQAPEDVTAEVVREISMAA